MKSRILLPIIVLASLATGRSAILAEWDTTGYLGDETAITVDSFATGLTSASSIGTGSELLTTTGGGGLNTTSWSTALAGSSGNYYGFSITVATGYEIDLTDLSFTARSSNTGPGNFAIRYSGDNYASDIDTYSTTNSDYGDFLLDLTSIGTLEAGTHEFRIGLTNALQSDGAGDVSASGTHRIMNPGSTGSDSVGAAPITLSGSIFAIPEPGSALLGGLGFLALLSQRRRLQPCRPH